MKISFPKFPKKWLLFLGVICLLIVVFLPSYYFYRQYQKSQKLLENPTEAAREETRSLVEKVGRLIELPTNEEPTIATVSDKEKLKEQTFFSKAENGDKVFIYTQAKKAILYRPSANKVIEVAPINLGQPLESSPAAAATSSASIMPAKVALYNGTTTVGLTNVVEKQLKDNLELGPKIEVVAKENAGQKDYAKTIVIDLTGTRKQLAQAIANILGGEISSLPQGEIPPKADILVILGK